MDLHESRAAWLAERRNGLGATDIASVLGVGFRTATEVYADKCGDAPLDSAPNPLMALGLATEGHNAALYAERTGARLIAPGLLAAQSEPWAFATYDRVRVDTGADQLGCPVELKYTTFFDPDKWGPDGTDQVRDGYIVQAVWQAAVLRDRGHMVERTDISALAGTGEHRIYHVPFDAPLAGLLFETGRLFWRRVEARAGVAGWDPPLALVDAIADRLATIRPDTSVPLGAEAIELADRYEALKAEKAAAEAEAKEIGGRMTLVREQLAALLGGAETGDLPDGRRVQQKIVHVAAHSREASSHVRFSILKAKKGKLS